VCGARAHTDTHTCRSLLSFFFVEILSVPGSARTLLRRKCFQLRILGMMNTSRGGTRIDLDRAVCRGLYIYIYVCVYICM
jgi:hypothetical protein